MKTKMTVEIETLNDDTFSAEDLESYIMEVDGVSNVKVTNFEEVE